MSQEVMLANIKAGLDHVDAAALQSIWEIISHSAPQTYNRSESIVRPALQRALTSEQSSQFVGENLTLEDYEKLPPKERGMLQRRLKERNHLWLQERFSTLKAAWLVVINGQMIDSGKSLQNEPMPPQILEICRRTGKFPFIFINDDFLAIEEGGGSTWHSTNALGDSYPTMPVSLSLNSVAVEIVGDFDTGAAHTFADYDFLRARNLIQPEVADYYKTSQHLSQSFDYVSRFFYVKLPATADTTQALLAKIYCVPDWHLSPFVKINPNRAALIGRDLMLALKPRVLLDFEQCQTEILPSSKTPQT